MTAESIAKTLGGHRAGATWMARCPAHEERKPSLSIRSGRDGKVLARWLQSTRRDRHPSPALRRHSNVEHTAAMLLEFAPAAFVEAA